MSSFLSARKGPGYWEVRWNHAGLLHWMAPTLVDLAHDQDSGMVNTLSHEQSYAVDSFHLLSLIQFLHYDAMEYTCIHLLSLGIPSGFEGLISLWFLHHVPCSCHFNSSLTIFCFQFCHR
jgi:hypothetical protein